MAQKSLKVIILPEQLAQVFTNLFDNALEAMSHTKNKRIRISIEPLVDEQLTIHIQDFGEGIPSHLRSIIFEESFSTKGSSDLGLYHARKFLRHYGGDLKLMQSSLGKGTIFQIKLRVAEP